MSHLDPGDVRALLEDLREARGTLMELTAMEIAAAVGTVGARFLNPDDPLRKIALERIPDEAGFSRAMAERVLDGMARDWTEPRLRRLLETEFRDLSVLDGFRPRPGEAAAARLRAMGDGVAVHIGSGSVPGVCATSVVRSLLVKTPVLVKPGDGDRALTELFLQGLEHQAPALAAAVVVAYWPGGEWELEEALLTGADRVVVYGSDETARL
ncbi:MAG TPA: acyl-CoA reductase, partial [Longimicrobiales bacterium]|nr:acyl-CoA reductase [Longimicrobiales bacterium]